MQPEPPPRRVLIVDDQDLVRTGLRMILGSAPDIDVVGEAADGEQALSFLRETPADVALMDVRMHVMDGIEATRRIRAEFPCTRVVLLTTFDDDATVQAGLRAGADGYLLKSASAEELIGCLRHVGEGRAVMDPGVTKRLLDRLLSEVPQERPVAADALRTLSPREREVFTLVAMGLPNAEIAESLSLSPVTVRTHIDNILTKLRLNHRPEIIVYAYKHGIIQTEPHRFDESSA